MKHLFLVLAFSGFFYSSANADVILYSEDFDTQAYPDQAPLVALDGDASVSFGANTTIGDTNATGDAAAGGIYMSTGAASGLATRNGTRGYITTADAGFTTGSGNVGQLHTHTSGGFAVLSVGPITQPGNVVTPIPVSASAGDTFRVTFDLFVQAARTQNNSNLNMNWNAGGATVGNTTWTQYNGAVAGDVTAASIEFTVDAAQAASLTDLAPQLTHSWTSGDVPVNTAYWQIDNFVFEQITAVPEPTSLTLLGLGLVGIAARRRKK